jgi:hypothetical protein
MHDGTAGAAENVSDEEYSQGVEVLWALFSMVPCDPKAGGLD